MDSLAENYHLGIESKEDYQLYRDYIKHEDSLINNRLTWLLVAQGLIFSAYSSLTVNMVNLYRNYNETCIQVISEKISLIEHLLMVFRVIGLCIGIVSLLGVIAAMAAIETLSQKRCSPLMPPLTGGGSPIAMYLGKVMPPTIPLVIILAWAYLIFTTISG